MRSVVFIFIKKLYSIYSSYLGGYHSNSCHHLSMRNLDSSSAKFHFEYKQLLKYFIKTIVATFFQKKKIAMVESYYILDKLNLVINMVVG